VVQDPDSSLATAQSQGALVVADIDVEMRPLDAGSHVLDHPLPEPFDPEPRAYGEETGVGRDGPALDRPRPGLREAVLSVRADAATTATIEREDHDERVNQPRTPRRSVGGQGSVFENSQWQSTAWVKGKHDAAHKSLSTRRVNRPMS